MNNFNDGSAMKCFRAIASELSTPLAEKARQLLAADDLKGVLELKVSPATYTCPKALLQDLQLVSFFKKFEDLPFGSSELREKAAVDLFWASERACFDTNRRLTPLLDDPYHFGERMHSFIAVWRKKVKQILRKAPSWEQLQCRFGSGATYDNKGSQISVADKLTDDYTVTTIQNDLISDWDKSAWSRYAACSLDPFDLSHSLPDDCHAIRDLIKIRGNRFTTVSKDWNKDRGICIEPSVNLFYQLGIGKSIARLLRRAGCDKVTGQEYHKILARIASMTRACATIDLSNASDTVAEVLIKLLLPDDWWTLLTSVRCTHTLVKGKWVRLEKFSSMGNGFTFELETLVFFTLCQAVAEVEGIREDPYTPGLTISAYGDDIIVPSSIAPCVISALKFFGFEPNQAKTFLDGGFRESCGGDYLHGVDVRPFYLKKDLDENHRYIIAANGLRRTRLRGAAAGLSSDFLAKPWRLLTKLLPSQIRRSCVGPEVLGDIVLHDDNWLRIGKSRTRNSIRYLRVWRPVMHRSIPLHHFRPGVVYAAKLYGDSQTNELYTDFRGKPVSPFVPRINGTYVSGYKLGWVPFS